MLKNALLQTILPWFRSPKLPLNAPLGEKILVVSTTALGDTLWATPALASLRTSFPDAFIGVLTSPIGIQILKHNPHVDELFVLKEPLLPRFFPLKNHLLQLRFDTVLLFHASQRLTLPLCSLLGAKVIAGTVGINKGLDSLLTHAAPSVFEHEISRRLNLVKLIGGKITAETLQFFLHPDEKLPPRSGRWIALHPGAKDGFKRWPIELFTSLGKKLQKELGAQILITGVSSEWHLMKALASGIPGAHLSDPSLSLRQFAALLDQMDLLICNDTGPFHLACALGKKAVALYAATDPKLCGPYKAPDAIAVSQKTSCTPCLKRKCNSPFCLLQISPDAVMEAVRTLWNRPSFTPEVFDHAKCL